MKVLITGANGQLGRALEADERMREHELVLTAHHAQRGYKTLDVTDEHQVFDLFESVMPDIVINCAAYTKVDACESDEAAGYRVNAIAAGNLAWAAKKNGAYLIHVSTDYVFDGEKREPYLVTDEVNPQTAYGRTKAAGEKLAAQYCGNLCIARTAWLYGDGNNFVRTMLKLAQTKDEVRVVNDQYGTPTSAKELACMLSFLAEKRETGIYHCVCDGSASWYDFACEIFKQKGLDMTVIPVSTREYGVTVPRPVYSVLDNSKLKATGFNPPAWQDALDEYLAKM